MLLYAAPAGGQDKVQVDPLLQGQVTIPTKAKALVLPHLASPTATAAERTGGAATNWESQQMARTARRAEAASPNTQKSWELEWGEPRIPRRTFSLRSPEQHMISRFPTQKNAGCKDLLFF